MQAKYSVCQMYELFHLSLEIPTHNDVRRHPQCNLTRGSRERPAAPPLGSRRAVRVGAPSTAAFPAENDEFDATAGREEDFDQRARESPSTPLFAGKPFIRGTRVVVLRLCHPSTHPLRTARSC